MSAQSVLEKAAAQGIALYVAGGRIRGRGAKPDPAFLAELREHEAELVDLLTKARKKQQLARPNPGWSG
jgi:hypothetical protein